jgi:hypothetical protein
MVPLPLHGVTVAGLSCLFLGLVAEGVDQEKARVKGFGVLVHPYLQPTSVAVLALWQALQVTW